jgi:hypothetical protein
MNHKSVLMAALSLAFAAMVLCVPSPAQASDSGYVSGTVSQSNKPVPSLWVVLSQGGQEKHRFLTGDDGKYYIGNVAAGAYEIKILKGRVQLKAETINLPADKNHDIEVPASVGG